ncbi:MAG TPA: glycosyltransferase family 4 protein [Ilumatobacteraceae bacterium]|nr:glycosyltransferase family 4 protein [Ilumatobacteraceae bacterium]
MTTSPSAGPSLAACTIVAHNYLPMARVLARSFLKWHPEASFSVIVIDHPLEARGLADEPFTVVPITELDFGDEGFENMATIYDVTEFATSVKPFALQHLLRSAECAFYIDPDIEVYERLDPLVDATMQAGITLTPHCLSPIAHDGAEPGEAAIMAAGVYNLGFIGVARRAGEFLQWWAARLRRWALIDPAQQLFTDQRWIDLAVPIFHPHIVRSTAYNVAYWNLDQRLLTKQQGRYLVDGEPLRFFHFSGYDPATPFWVSKYQQSAPRVLMSEQPALVELCSEYAASLAASRRPTDSHLPYGWHEAFPGVVLCRELRRFFHAELVRADRGEGEVPPSPFLPGGAERFRHWLCTVAPDSVAPATRSAMAIWHGRADLRAATPDVADGRADGLRHWVERGGMVEYPHLALLGWTQPRPASDSSPAGGDGVDLVGYLTAELGVGQAGRLAEQALTAAGVDVATTVTSRTLSRQRSAYDPSGAAGHRTIVAAVNADQLGLLRRDLGAGFFEGRYTIGQWFWETESFPVRFHHAFSWVDEVWAATTHMCDAFTAGAPTGLPVTHMPLPLLAPPVDHTLSRAALGLTDRFTFLFCFDMFSIIERKNPLAIVNAFRAAFRPNEGPALVIKTINGGARLAALEHLRWQCRDRDDITVIDGYLDTATSGALMAHADCYISLHRAEGLGLTMAEAMSLGKPVIATAYSGNMDFMTPETALLVPWSPVAVPSGAEPYDVGSVWADPDIGVAASLMQRVVADPELAARIAAAGQRDLAARFSPAVCGARMRQRLEQIWSTDVVEPRHVNPSAGRPVDRLEGGPRAR